MWQARKCNFSLYINQSENKTISEGSCLPPVLVCQNLKMTVTDADITCSSLKAGNNKMHFFILIRRNSSPRHFFLESRGRTKVLLSEQS